ncbi:MAG TPA: hypothetical protein VLJ86_20795 [Ramlibacter sp.]|nr:hypothetical protein [Ramlibacter sp.]
MKKVKLVVQRHRLSPEFRRVMKAAAPYVEFLVEHGVSENSALMYGAILSSPGRRTRMQHLAEDLRLSPDRPIPDVVQVLARELDRRGGL